MNLKVEGSRDGNISTQFLIVATAEVSQELNVIHKEGCQHRTAQSWKEQSDLALNNVVRVLTNIAVW